MPENMSISVNGHSQVPPGFRFHPTEEELLQYYLRKKVSNQKIDLDVIREIDLHKLEPWDVQEECKIGTTPQNECYFFSHKNKKYPTGTRTNRATAIGFWKATGRDKTIYSNRKRIGMRKTLVFYQGRAPHGLKSDWIMHEYRLDDGTIKFAEDSNMVGETALEEVWVVCRIFKKKFLHKTLYRSIPSSETTSQSLMVDSGNGAALKQMMQQYMGDWFMEENEENNCRRSSPGPFDTVTGRGIDNNGFQDTLFELPRLESPNPYGSHLPVIPENWSISGVDSGQGQGQPSWVAFDRLLAAQLNGDNLKELSNNVNCNNEIDQVNLASSWSSNEATLQLPDTTLYHIIH